MLRSMVRGGRPPRRRPSPLPLRIAAAEAATEETRANGRSKVGPTACGGFSGSGPSLRDELSELVKEDPDAAANILRAWIGQRRVNA